MILTPCVTFFTIFTLTFVMHTLLHAELWACVLTLSQNPKNVLVK